MDPPLFLSLISFGGPFLSKNVRLSGSGSSRLTMFVESPRMHRQFKLVDLGFLDVHALVENALVEIQIRAHFFTMHQVQQFRMCRKPFKQY